MTTLEADKHLKRIQNYLGSTDSMTQFWDACKIAEDALYEVKKLNKSEITTKQQIIARQEAKNIVREYLDSQDESELEEGIYEAIIEALKHSANASLN